MSDIVERLRAWSPLIASGMEVPAASLTAEEAADEITRLCAEVEEQARLLGMSGEREAKLLARVEELEKALTEISEYCCDADPTVSTIQYAVLRALGRAYP
jgi:hypothetical protein